MTAAPALLLPGSDTFSVGIGIIDSQHKNLVGMVNDLHQAMSGGHGKDQLGRVLSSLVKYTQVHFKTEENLMESHRYPDYDRHKSEHERLTATVLDIQGKFQRNEIGLSIEVMDFLKNWLYHHTLESDKR
jgi:hemerythrin-like metal-binding protein